MQGLCPRTPGREPVPCTPYCLKNRVYILNGIAALTRDYSFEETYEKGFMNSLGFMDSLRFMNPFSEIACIC